MRFPSVISERASLWRLPRYSRARPVPVVHCTLYAVHCAPVHPRTERPWCWCCCCCPLSLVVSPPPLHRGGRPVREILRSKHPSIHTSYITYITYHHQQQQSPLSALSSFRFADLRVGWLPVSVSRACFEITPSKEPASSASASLLLFFLFLLFCRLVSSRLLSLLCSALLCRLSLPVRCICEVVVFCCPPSAFLGLRRFTAHLGRSCGWLICSPRLLPAVRVRCPYRRNKA